MKKQIVRSILVGGGIAVLGAGTLSGAAVFAASSNSNTVINAAIGSTISISTSGTVTLNITPTGAGSATSASDTVTVSTNNATGYTLQLADADATVTLTNGGNTIGAATGTFAAPAALGVNTWGYRVDSVGTFGAGPTSAQSNAASLSGTWAAVPASGSPATLKTTGSTASGDTTTVWYGASANTTKPNGTYTDTVTYTATTN